MTQLYQFDRREEFVGNRWYMSDKMPWKQQNKEKRSLYDDQQKIPSMLSSSTLTSSRIASLMSFRVCQKVIGLFIIFHGGLRDASCYFFSYRNIPVQQSL